MNRTAIACTTIAGLALVAAAIALGPLNPPSGAVVSTNKTLAEVEPRIAINATNTPGSGSYMFRISQPGSYYLTGNITGDVDKVVIGINANNVTIDLNGFTIFGNPSSTAFAAGVAYAGLPTNFTIRNGTIRDFASGSGIDLVGIANATITDLQFINNSQYGIRGGTNFTIERCFARGGTVGISVGSNGIASHCSVASAATGLELNGSCIVHDCQVNSATTALSCTGGNIVRNNIFRCGASGLPVGTGISTNSFDNRFEANHISFATTGISLGTSGNVVSRNTFSRVTSPIFNGAGNIIAPIINSGTIGTNTNPDANIQQ
jgi:hypothetical protein